MLRPLIFAGMILPLASCMTPRSNAPSQRLGNPVSDARAALLKGDSTFVGILDDVLRLPGTSATVAEETQRTVRAFSRQSLGLTSSEWAGQRDSLTVYAAAYNSLIQEARENGAHRVH